MSVRKLLVSLVVGVCGLNVLPAAAQGGSGEDGIQAANDPQLLEAFAEIEEMGPELNPVVIQRTGALFARLHESSNTQGVQAQRDLSYGPDDKQLLDVYTPQEDREPLIEGRPAVVFIHGGGLVAGDKDNAVSDLMYANVATYFARHGMVGVNATYRLVPGITYPQGGEDMRAIVQWVRDNAQAYGIDPEKIFFLCSSAGCTHVASLLFDRDMMSDGTPDIAGAIMLSGAYQADNEDYYGSDQQVMLSRSPLALAEAYQGEPVPVFLFSAEFDPNYIELMTARMYTLLCEKRASCPRFTQARDHNHLSINQHINTSDERYSRQMLKFIREVSAQEGAGENIGESAGR